VEITRKDSGLSISIENAKGEREESEFDSSLVAVGRSPHSKGIGLENNKIAFTERGFIRVDVQQRTAAANIFAVTFYPCSVRSPPAAIPQVERN